MAKKQSKKQVRKVKNGGSSKARKTPAPGRLMYDPQAQQMVSLLTDPCTAKLEHGVYPGAMGMINRFVATRSVATAAGQNCLVYQWTPATNVFWSIAATNADTAVTPSYGSTGQPGSTFLGSNARSSRCLGACISIVPDASITNIQGIVYVGNAPHAIAANAGTPTLNQLLQVLPTCYKANQTMKDFKWSPGTLDNLYQQYQSIPTADEWDGFNSMYVIITGLPANTSFTLRLTYICEWLPGSGVGLPTPSRSNPSNTSVSSIVGAIEKRDPGWWLHDAGTVINKFIGTVPGAGVASTVLRTAGKVLPLLL